MSRGLALVLILVGVRSFAAPPTDLLTEWLPGQGVVVSDPCPELSWQADGQVACQVRCGPIGGPQWDNGRRQTPVGVVEYGGPPLQENETYSWQVRHWGPEGVSDWTAPLTFSYRRRAAPGVRPHIRTFMNFGGSTQFAVENLDLTFRREPNELRPEILSLQYSLLATMVIPSPKAEDLAQFCVEKSLTREGILEEMFAHFGTDTKVTLHVGAERAENPRETRLCPGWDPANDRNGDGHVDDAEAARPANPKATARRMSQARIPIYYWGPPRDDWVMNVSHPEYQRFVAEVYCPAQAEGYDGLYVDTMPADVPAAGRAAQVLEFPRPAEDPDQWLHAMQTMLQRIKTAMPGSIITANGWDSDPFVIDGTQSEGWLRITTALSGYEDTLRRTQALDRRGKIQMIQYNPVFDPELSEFGARVPVAQARDALFGLASYYLVHGDFTYWAYGGHPYARVQELWPGAAAVDIGAPQGDWYVVAESGEQEDTAGENLLPAGDFDSEADGDGNPDGWESAEPVELDGEVKHSGRSSACIRSTSRQINNINKQYVTLKPNTAYTLSCWIKTEGVAGAPGAQVYPYEFEGVDAGMITVTGTRDWARQVLCFTTGEDAEGRVNFRIYGATGTAWFDDIRLTEGTDAPWKVLGRRFSGALVLVRPYCGGDWEARGDPIALSGPMRPLAADGSPGAPVTSVSLRNGEAAILMGE